VLAARVDALGTRECKVAFDTGKGKNAACMEPSNNYSHLSAGGKVRQSLFRVVAGCSCYELSV
jgi:hypothetical protein